MLLKKEPNKVQTAYIVYDMAPFIRCSLLESFGIKPTMNSSSLGSHVRIVLGRPNTSLFNIVSGLSIGSIVANHG